MAILAGAIALTALLVAIRFNWGALIGPAFIGLFLYRYLRNRKKRLLASFVKKVAKFPEVRVVVAREARVTVVVDKAPAKVYIRITALIDDLNRRLFVGKDFAAEVKSELPEAEVRAMQKQVGVVYARDDDRPAGEPEAIED
jgi:hypothetical protein